jgi:hypothetical protein
MFDFILVKTHFQRLKYFISLLKERNKERDNPSAYRKILLEGANLVMNKAEIVIITLKMVNFDLLQP